MDEIKVHVVNKSRRYLYMRYICPQTGKTIEKSTGESSPKAAAKVAAVWEAELREGRYVKPSKMTWEAFREYYETHALPAVAKTSVGTYQATFNVFEKLCNPQKLADVTTTRVTGFVTELRKLGRTEATVARHLRHLKAICRWGRTEKGC